MFVFQSKTKRQIQILGIIISPKKHFTVTQLAAIFNVEELTIRRDLRELREEGILIHSTKKYGVCLERPLEEQQLKEIILHFMGLNYTQHTVDRSTSSLIKKYHSSALENIVLLQLAIDNSEVIRVMYYDEEIGDFFKRRINPLLIFQNDGSWRVLSQDGKLIKQFLLEKISEVELTGEKFQRITSAEFDELFSNSWKSWIGKDRIPFKLHISKQWSERLIHKTFLKDQKIEMLDDGTVFFEAEVNSLVELAAWIVSRGKGIKVIYPDELKDAVINLAKECLGNYEFEGNKIQK